MIIEGRCGGFTVLSQNSGVQQALAIYFLLWFCVKILSTSHQTFYMMFWNSLPNLTTGTVDILINKKYIYK